MRDFKRLLGYLGPYRLDMVLGALLVLVESAFELFIPVLMSDIIVVGVANRDVVFILHNGVQMGICAILALVTGLLDCWMLSLLIWGGMALSGGSVAWLSQEAVSGSVLYSLFAGLNPFWPDRGAY